ncbi:MAG TPA: lytic transglycosylase domain-containing protein [Sphingopyxis sp.]|uniref:lytic transglycosylase domain-containing protein n=1 Tax=Sphingopyxis sp. TaxID=1908224 RepID=UPI002E371994|nr:lytic transglycosylase domain-containing protein [Sphingopyxis sp.]HEX2814601.1 lytic transglycosylase domain-containing protein [Sphingopyxis sp.]
MAAVRIALAALALLAALPAEAQSVDRWRPYIVEASARYGVPVEWIERVMRAESGGRTTLDGRPIVSRAGAMGLMQLMPGTWADMRARLGLGNDPHAPRDNIMAGTYYLRLMYDRFGYPGLFGAYNAGPARYSAWLAGRSGLPGETRAYMATVTRTRTPQQAAAPRLFVARRIGALPVAAPMPPAPARGALFFWLSGAGSTEPAHRQHGEEQAEQRQDDADDDVTDRRARLAALP